jgi:hypothetical protein
MAYFDYTLLTADMAAKTGYKLYSDFGEISPADIPHRRVNEIVTPVVGVFRLNPVPLTALATPYIAVVSGTIEIPAPSEVAEDIRKHLNEVAADFNAKAERQTQGDTTFTVVYNFETCSVDDKRRDVGLYNGEIVVITQTVTFTIVERGITALDTELKINGLSVPFLRLDESRVSTSETTPNTEGHGEVSVTQEMYGITFDTPLMDNSLGEMLLDVVNNGAGNKAFAVEVIRNGKSSAYLMAVGTAATSANPPANIGVSISMAEINPMAAMYNDLFSKSTLRGTVVTLSVRNAFVYWGDGLCECINGHTPHVYTDGATAHTAYVLPYGNAERYGNVVQGASLFRKVLRPKRTITVEELPATVLTTSENDKIVVSGGRVSMVVGGVYIAIDEYDPNLNVSLGINHPFACLLRGTVKQINTDLLEYDRWAVSEEV